MLGNGASQSFSIDSIELPGQREPRCLITAIGRGVLRKEILVTEREFTPQLECFDKRSDETFTIEIETRVHENLRRFDRNLNGTRWRPRNLSRSARRPEFDYANAGH